MKIVSRLREDELQLNALREIVEAVSYGEIGPNGTMELADDLPGLVVQLDFVCASLLTTLTTMDQIHALLAQKNHELVVKLAEQRRIVARVSDGVDFDEVLDQATMDLMEAFLSSGAATPTFDGELHFEEAVVFSKSDLKPILREAIDSWLRLKLR